MRNSTLSISIWRLLWQWCSRLIYRDIFNKIKDTRLTGGWKIFTINSVVYTVGALVGHDITSQIRSRIEYLIPSDNIPVLLLHSNLILKSCLFDEFSIRFNDNSDVAYFLLGHPVYRKCIVQQTRRARDTVMFLPPFPASFPYHRG